MWPSGVCPGFIIEESMKPTEIADLIKNRQVDQIRELIKQGVLVVQNGKIKYAGRQGIEEEEYWDKRQHIKKIILNSVYGALLQAGCRFFDKRIGQSTTLSGRQIAKHMAASTNEIITGEYNHVGAAVVYGDSVTGDTLIRTDAGEMTISELFNKCLEFSIVDEKEYGVWNPHKVMGFNAYEDNTVLAKTSYVMRHRTKKKIYQINLANGKNVKVTEDHSIMVDRSGFLIEVKPTEILKTDLVICLSKND